MTVKAKHPYLVTQNPSNVFLKYFSVPSEKKVLFRDIFQVITDLVGYYIGQVRRGFNFFYWLNKRQVIFNTNSRVVGVITTLVSGGVSLWLRGSPISPAPTQCVRERVLYERHGWPPLPGGSCQTQLWLSQRSVPVGNRQRWPILECPLRQCYAGGHFPGSNNQSFFRRKLRPSGVIVSTPTSPAINSNAWNN